MYKLTCKCKVLSCNWALRVVAMNLHVNVKTTQDLIQLLLFLRQSRFWNKKFEKKNFLGLFQKKPTEETEQRCILQFYVNKKVFIDKSNQNCQFNFIKTTNIPQSSFGGEEVQNEPFNDAMLIPSGYHTHVI